MSSDVIQYKAVTLYLIILLFGCGQLYYAKILAEDTAKPPQVTKSCTVGRCLMQVNRYKFQDQTDQFCMLEEALHNITILTARRLPVVAHRLEVSWLLWASCEKTSKPFGKPQPCFFMYTPMLPTCHNPGDWFLRLPIYLLPTTTTLHQSSCSPILTQ